MSNNQKLEALRELKYVVEALKELKKPNGEFEYSMDARIGKIVDGIVQITTALANEVAPPT